MPGMIVAPQPDAVEAGAHILANGGNAFDAAVACAGVQFLIDPHSCGIGGYMVMAYHLADSEVVQPILDAPATAGSGVTPSMWEDQVIGPNPRGWGFFLEDKVNEDGYQAICTPGVMRGIETMLNRWCTRELSELWETAIRFCAEGWPVSAGMAARWKEPPMYYETSSLRQKLNVSPEAQRIYLKSDGTTLEMGDVLHNPDYGRTLGRVVEKGVGDFYTGDLAGEMIADLTAHEAWVTAEDLRNYTVREEPAVVGTYRGLQVVSSQPPHGGPTLIAILNILEGYELRSLGHNSAEYIYLVSMAMKAAFADRNRHLADPQHIKVPLEWLTSKERAAEWRDVIDRGEPINVGRRQHDAPDTTHVTVVDDAGNCVSLTHSLGTSSGVISPKLGFMYNNSMVNFEPQPGHPNSIAPGKGRTTGMTPTMVLKDSKPMLVLGAPGATRITTSVLQVILNHVDFGMGISDAVWAPRFDCQGNEIVCQARIPQQTCDAVGVRHPTQRLPQSHGGMALVHAIAIDEMSGTLSGAADTGGEGMALLVE